MDASGKNNISKTCTCNLLYSHIVRSGEKVTQYDCNFFNFSKKYCNQKLIRNNTSHFCDLRFILHYHVSPRQYAALFFKGCTTKFKKKIIFLFKKLKMCIEQG